MISHFIRLEWKQYFRSSYWQKSLVLNIFLVLFALYFVVTFLAIGVGGYFILKKLYPESDPLMLVNSYLLFALVGDLVFRYLMQKLPVMNIKPLLILPIKKSKLVNYVLRKSMISFFNVMPLFFYVPFAIVLINQGYDTLAIMTWLFTLIVVTQSLNLLNFLINKNNKAFYVVLSVLALMVGLKYIGLFDVSAVGVWLFDGLMSQPFFALIPVLLFAFLYRLNYKQLYSTVYLDEAVATKVKEAKTADLSWADALGTMAPFIKNDIRLIWRNKRTKTVFLMSFFFLFYGLIFFPNPAYKDMQAFLVFAAMFVTGGFTINYGQFIPSWESAYYKMLMTQNLRYRQFLESKWILMVVMTSVLYFMSIPYLFFGWKVFLMITAGAIYNIGFNSLFLLYSGSYNRKPVELNAGGFGNTQGTSATQFLIVLPVMGLPMLLFYLFNLMLGFYAGILAIIVVGLSALIFKKSLMTWIERKYIRDKYAAIHAFNKKS